MYEALQFLDRTFDVIALATQQRDTLLAFLDRDQALQLAAVADVVKVDHLTDVGEAEAGALGAQYPGEPCPVTLRIDARQTLARRADQPLVLIEAQRARGDRKSVGWGKSVSVSVDLGGRRIIKKKKKKQKT